MSSGIENGRSGGNNSGTVESNRPKSAVREKIVVKILVLGCANVGKTSLIERYCLGRFHGRRIPTVGADFMTKKLIIDDVQVTIQVWDTAGQERFHQNALGASFYRGAHGALLVYDVNNEKSFEQVSLWSEEVLSKIEPGSYFPIVVVGNKVDLRKAVPEPTPVQSVAEGSSIGEAEPPAEPEDIIDSQSIPPTTVVNEEIESAALEQPALSSADAGVDSAAATATATMNESDNVEEEGFISGAEAPESVVSALTEDRAGSKTAEVEDNREEGKGEEKEKGEDERKRSSIQSLTEVTAVDVDSSSLPVQDSTQRSNSQSVSQQQSPIQNQSQNHDQQSPQELQLQQALKADQANILHWCHTHSYGHVETSAKDNLGVEAAMTTMAALALEAHRINKRSGNEKPQRENNTIRIAELYEEKQAKSCC